LYHLQVVCERGDVLASGSAVARILPLYTSKSGAPSDKGSVTVEFLLVGADSEGGLSASDVASLAEVSQGIRLAAKIVDMPCADMHTDAFLEVLGQDLNVFERYIYIILHEML